jgi:hypothetical protein
MKPEMSLEPKKCQHTKGYKEATRLNTWNRKGEQTPSSREGQQTPFSRRGNKHHPQTWKHPLLVAPIPDSEESAAARPLDFRQSLEGNLQGNCDSNHILIFKVTIMTQLLAKNPRMKIPYAHKQWVCNIVFPENSLHFALKPKHKVPRKPWSIEIKKYQISISSIFRRFLKSVSSINYDGNYWGKRILRVVGN